MQQYPNIDNFKVKVPVVATIGTFDGVHIGHQQIIKTLIEEAKKINGETVVLTFSPHPRTILQSEPAFSGVIYTKNENMELLYKLGIQHLIDHPFSKRVANLSANEFIERFIIKVIRPKTIVVGYNHHFGKNRAGGVSDLMKYSLHNQTSTIDDKSGKFQVIEVLPKQINNISVSSTIIRQLLLKGDVKTASAFLGRDFSITGKVIKGNGIGRSIGFPTANIGINTSKYFKIVPAKGVYAVKVKIISPSHGTGQYQVTSHLGGKWKLIYKMNLKVTETNNLYNGMVNIGFRPTLYPNQPDLTIEVHIFGFKENILGKEITVYFKERIRDEMKFKNIKELKEQLLLDKEKIVNILTP